MMMFEKNKKKTDENSLIIRFVKLLDVVIVTTVFDYVWMHFFGKMIYPYPFYNRGNIVIVLLYAVLYAELVHLYQGFYINLNRISDIIFSQILAVIINNAIFYIIISILSRRIPNILPMFICLGINIIVIMIWSKAAHDWYFRHHAPKKTIIIYDELQGIESLIKDNGLDIRFDVIDETNICNVDTEYIHHKLNNAEVVFLCSLHSHERNQIIKYCVEKDIEAFVVPRIGDVIMSGAEMMPLMHQPMLLVGRYNPHPEYLFMKRLFDIVFSGLGLILLSPLMLVLALVIRSDGGTALYKQVRLTKDGKEFEILKFRSMKMDAEKDGIARLSTGENDPRITRIGHFIRTCRMDELPQLINIFKGDMSFVGPRPERPEIAREYEQKLPEFKLRLQCKCGLTGFAQVYGKYNSTPYEKLLMDLMYISKPSLAGDLKIMLATIKILFQKDSTEGIMEGQTNAGGNSNKI